MEEEHPVVDIDIADGGAGLAICRGVRQLVILPESLTSVGGADASGDVIFLGDDVVPDPVNRLDIFLIPGQGGHIRYSGIHVGRPHGVAHGLILLSYRQMGLVVRIPVGGAASPVEEIFGLVEILLLAGHEVKAAKGHLGDLMAGNPVHLAGTKADLADHAVGVLDGDVQEITLARGLIMRHGSLDHVTEIVELVAEFLDLLPSFCPDHSWGCLGFIVREV